MAATSSTTIADQ